MSEYTVERVKLPAGTVIKIGGLPFRIAMQAVVEAHPDAVAALKLSDLNIERANRKKSDSGEQGPQEEK